MEVETAEAPQPENGQNSDSEEVVESPFKSDKIAPKKYGIKANPEEEALEVINQEFLEDPDYAEVENLKEQLQTIKEKFLEFDKDSEGNIDMFGLSRMMEKLGQAKTHLEMRKMIREIDSTNKGTICYRDFIAMMCGPKNSVLKLILLFEQKMKEQEKPTGVAPKRDLASLP
ncbi:apoptosis-inducing factor [Mactra antiquata]